MNPVLWRFVIHGSPIVKKNTQKAGIIAGHMRIYYSRQYKDWLRSAAYELSLQRRPAEPISTPIILSCKFFMQSNRRVDLSALYEGIQDLLVTAGVLEDDNFKIVIGHDGSRVSKDAGDPRMEIEVLKGTSPV